MTDLVPVHSADVVAAWSARLRASLARSVEAIVATGQLLLEAKAALPHGKWLEALDGADLNPRVAQMFIAVAEDPSLSDTSTYSHLLPAAYNTLYVLSRIQPKERLLEALETGEVSPTATLSEARALAKSHGITPTKTPPLPKGTFTTLLMDPPWRFDEAGPGARSSADSKYPTMSLEEIADLELPRMAPGAHLYFWCPTQFLVPAHEIVEGYGFQVRSVLAWTKPNGLGVGRYFRGGWEPCLFATRGDLQLKVKNQAAWFEAPRTKHSSKPANFITDIVERCSPGPYVEMFARNPERRKDWTYWGYEAQ